MKLGLIGTSLVGGDKFYKQILKQGVGYLIIILIPHNIDFLVFLPQIFFPRRQKMQLLLLFIQLSVML